MDSEPKHKHIYKLVRAVGLVGQTWMIWKSPLPQVWQQLFHSTPAVPMGGNVWPDTWTPKASAFTLDAHCVKRKDDELPVEPGWDEEMVWRTLEQCVAPDSGGWKGRVVKMAEADTLEELLSEMTSRADGHLTILNPAINPDTPKDQP